MSNTSSERGLAMSESEQQNVPLQEKSELKLTRTELTLIKKLPSQIKEIVSQNARIEHQLHTLNREITTTPPYKIESRESLKRLQTQVAQLETRLIKIGNAFDNVVANIKLKKKKKGKKKNKQSKK
jgi:hypothetical protein